MSTPDKKVFIVDLITVQQNLPDKLKPCLGYNSLINPFMHDYDEADDNPDALYASIAENPGLNNIELKPGDYLGYIQHVENIVRACFMFERVYFSQAELFIIRNFLHQGLDTRIASFVIVTNRMFNQKGNK